MSEPRNWKWMVPGNLGVVLLVVYAAVEMKWGVWANIPLGLALMCFAAAALNMLIYAWDHYAQAWVGIRHEQNSTPEVRLAEAMKNMHPQTAEAVMMHRRTIWRVKYVARRDLVDWVLDEAPTIHVGFVEFVLDRSSDFAVMPKRFLAEGSKQYDPDGVITDRQQYDDLILLWQRKMVCTSAIGNQAPAWLPPWKPDVLRHQYGIEGQEEEAKPESTPAAPPKTVKPMAAMAEPVYHPAYEAARREPEVKPLTDEELARIRAEEARYRNKIAVQ